MRIREIKTKVKEFLEEHEMEIGMCISIAEIIAIAAVYYSLGSDVAALKIGKGLYNLHKSNELHLYDQVRQDLVCDLEEVHQIVKYAKNH